MKITNNFNYDNRVLLKKNYDLKTKTFKIYLVMSF